jgi:hypothetical protein
MSSRQKELSERKQNDPIAPQNEELTSSKERCHSFVGNRLLKATTIDEQGNEQLMRQESESIVPYYVPYSVSYCCTSRDRYRFTSTGEDDLLVSVV